MKIVHRVTRTMRNPNEQILAATHMIYGEVNRGDACFSKERVVAALDFMGISYSSNGNEIYLKAEDVRLIQLTTEPFNRVLDVLNLNLVALEILEFMD